MAETEVEHVSIQFEPGETGWASLAPGAVKPSEDSREVTQLVIDNIPYTDRLNIGDVVEAERHATRSYMFVVKRVLTRAFEGKTALDYGEPHKETYAKVWTALKAAGMKVEGLFPGLLLVAHRKGEDPVEVARTAGVTVKLHETQPDLEEVPSGPAAGVPN